MKLPRSFSGSTKKTVDVFFSMIDGIFTLTTRVSGQACFWRITVEDQVTERWRELCAQASTEKDPKRLLELAEEINRLLDEKEKALLSKRQNPAA
jgi:hypothetical protein